MIPFSPFSSPMNYYRNSYYRTPPKNYKSLPANINSNSYSHKISEKEDYKTQESSTRSKPDSTREFFDIFGIRLYFDDILILCLLFFLYQEKVDDQLLFIALLLLLLS